jgi:phenylalanyl-tRNA synthetase beta chain
MLRRSLLPGLLQTLSINIDYDLPQVIFEAGNVTVLDDSVPTGAREVPHLAVAAIGPQVGFDTVRSILNSVAHEFGKAIETAPDDTPTYIPGRAAKILLGPERTPIGALGEIHPEVLESHKLIYPAAAFEVRLSSLA